MAILVHGEVVNTPEELEAKQKQAWLFLTRSLRMTDERLKALRVPVPVSLEEDYDVAKELVEARDDLSRFNSLEDYKAYITQSEHHYSKDFVLDVIRNSSPGPRQRWIIDRVRAENPLTILDVGGGYGEIACALARLNFQVTTLVPNKSTFDAITELQIENGWPIQPIQCVFKEFNPETKFDVVIAGEILEHVYDDYTFIHQCAEMAKRSVVATTPSGSCEAGFYPGASWRIHTEHVRCYSDKGFENLISSIPGLKPDPKIEKITSVIGLRGQNIDCYCVVLDKEVVNAQEEGYGSKHQTESDGGTHGQLRESEALGV